MRQDIFCFCIYDYLLEDVMILLFVYFEIGILQGTTVRVEFGDSTTAADPAGAHTISRTFPHTYGQPLAHFLRETAKVLDAQIITEHPPIRCAVCI